MRASGRRYKHFPMKVKHKGHSEFRFFAKVEFYILGFDECIVLLGVDSVLLNSFSLGWGFAQL